MENLEEKESEAAKNEDTKPILKNDHGKMTFYLASCVTIATIGAGFQFGWSVAILNNPAHVIKEFIREVYKKNNGLEMSNSALNTCWAIMNGLLPFGGIFGSLLSSWLADSFGRKHSLLTVNLVMITSAIVGIISKYLSSYYVLMVSRLLSGLYLGVSNTILPIYLSECSSNNIRGSMGTLIHFSTVFGVLFAQVLGMPEVLGSRDFWPILIGLSLVPSLVQCLLIFYCETPKYIYVFLKDNKKAETVLLKLRGGEVDEVNLELNELEDERKALESIPPWKSFLTEKVLFRALVVAVMIQIAQQLTGINSYTFYSNQIFYATGFSVSQASLIVIVSSIIDLVFTFVSMYAVDKSGRRPLLIWSSFGMLIFSILLTLGRIYADASHLWIGYMTTLSFIVFNVFFSIGFGPIPKYITSELFVSSARARGNAVAFFFHWLSVFFVVVCFPFVDSALGSFSTFIFTGCLLLITFYVIMFVPETKNKPIDKIAAEFNERVLFYSSTSKN